MPKLLPLRTPIAGHLTKKERPVERIVVDGAEAQVVNTIFRKFLGGTSIARITQQLNEDPTLPRPRKSGKKQFSKHFVVRVLKSVKYLGIAVYKEEVDVSSKTPDEMRELAKSNGAIFSFPERQIISDEVFLAAREKLLNNADQPHLRRRKAKRATSHKRPCLLNGMLFCPGCNNQLIATGARGETYGCKTCKYHPVEQQHLFSTMPRKLATERVVDAICNELFDSQQIIDQTLIAFFEAVSELQRPDPSVMKKLRSEQKKVKGRLKLLLSTFKGDTSELVEEELHELQGDLARISHATEKQKLLDQAVVSIPTEGEAAELMMNFDKVLRHFVFNCDGEELDQARRIIELVTGGRISVCNWIRDSFEAEGKTKPDGRKRRKRIEAARGLSTIKRSVTKCSSWPSQACICKTSPKSCILIAMSLQNHGITHAINVDYLRLTVGRDVSRCLASQGRSSQSQNRQQVLLPVFFSYQRSIKSTYDLKNNWLDVWMGHTRQVFAYRSNRIRLLRLRTLPWND